MTLNNMENNWSTEIESFNIKFVHISRKANILADTLSGLIYTNPDLKQQPELEGHEFGKYCFETLPKVRGLVILCSSQTRLRPLLVQTQGMQLLKVFIQLYYSNSHQQYENEVSHSSMFKITML